MMVEFFQMDGYGGYIWSAYLIAALVLGAMVVATLKAFYRTRKILAGLKPDHEA